MTRYPLCGRLGGAQGRSGATALSLLSLFFLNISCFTSDCTSLGCRVLVLSDMLFVSFYLGDFFYKIVHTIGLYYYGPGVDSASNRNEYKECFLGGESGRCVGLKTLPPSCADCLEIWEPKPPGTLRACPGLCRDWFTLQACITLRAFG